MSYPARPKCRPDSRGISAYEYHIMRQQLKTLPPKKKDSDKQTSSCSDSQKTTSRRRRFLGQSDSGGGMGSSRWTHCLKPTHFLLGEPCSNTQTPHGIYSCFFRGAMFIYTSNLINHAVFSLNKSGNLNSQRQTHCLDKRLQQGPACINTQAGSTQRLM